MGEGKYNRIFIATDDRRILEKFSCRYGNKLIFLKMYRGGTGTDPSHLAVQQGMSISIIWGWR